MVTDPRDGERLHSVLAVKRKLGLVTAVEGLGSAAADGARARGEAEVALALALLVPLPLHLHLPVALPRPLPLTLTLTLPRCPWTLVRRARRLVAARRA